MIEELARRQSKRAMNKPAVPATAGSIAKKQLDRSCLEPTIKPASNFAATSAASPDVTAFTRRSFMMNPTTKRFWIARNQSAIIGVGIFSLLPTLLVTSCDENQKNRSASKANLKQNNPATIGKNTPPHNGSDEGESRVDNGTFFNSTSEYVKLGGEILEDKNSVLSLLNKMGPGRNRRNFLRNISHEFTSNLAIPVESGITLLKILDDEMYVEDTHSIGIGDMQRLVGRMEVADALILVGELKNPSIKSSFLDALGRTYASQNIVPSEEALRGLKLQEINKVYTTIGEEIKFDSATALIQFLQGQDRNNQASQSLAIAVLSTGHGLDSYSLIDAAIQARGVPVSGQVFALGFSDLIKSDSLDASQFLVQKKGALDPELYRIGVQELVDHLERKGTTQEATQWKRELETPTK